MTIGEAGHTTKVYAILEPLICSATSIQLILNQQKKSKNTLWPSHLVQHRNAYPKTSHFKEPEGVPALTSWRAKIALLHPGKSCGRHRLLWSIQISTPCCWNGMCWGCISCNIEWLSCMWLKQFVGALTVMCEDLFPPRWLVPSLKTNGCIAVDQNS